MTPFPSPGTLQIRVRSGTRRTEYPIRIAQGLSRVLGSELDALVPGSRRLIVSSPAIWALHGEAIAAGLPDTAHILVPDGEKAKQLRTVSRLYDALLDARADRRTVIVIVGGGVLGDLGGFAAASFLRGLPVVQVPTTVVAQVDSAIGGKVGVNHPRGKNLIGAFHPPLAVLTDPLLLRTLPPRELAAGLYEVMKYGVISDARLFGRLERDLPALLEGNPEALTAVVAASSRIKAHVVSVDEHETGLRRILNFGHTLGHALEAITNYRRFLHGEAVGWGMLAATEIARARGELDDESAARVVALVNRVGPRPRIDDLSAAECVAATGRDKKVVSGSLHFVLPVRIGKTRITTDVTAREMTRALRALGMSA
ncbi:MAG TPA: 3-dehydroquinate synthase [Vicinamibacterales bacterium]